jgi:Ca-activated chloride channel family protein
MWSLAWPWMLLALPLPLIVRALMPAVVGTQDAGLKVPSFSGFSVLADRSEVEQLFNWRFWLAVIAWLLRLGAQPDAGGRSLGQHGCQGFRTW